MSPDLEPARLAMLARYGPVVAGLRWVPLGSGGGFSGARVWRGDDSSGAPLLALKAWPDTTTAEHLARVHGWMTRAAHLPFVPGVVRTSQVTTVVVEAGRSWDLCRWMPGTADFESNPTPVRVANACAAVAALHQSWSPDPVPVPCPGVLNRLRLLSEFRSWTSAPGSLLAVHPVLEPVLQRAWDVAARVAPVAEDLLRPWATVPVRVRPCVRDLRADHVLFTGDAVTGIIDFGAMTEDHPAVDLARLLGDLAADDATFAAGLAVYRASASDPDVADGFVRLLARTGAVCSVVGWLRRVVVTSKPPNDPAAAAARLGRLLARAQNSFPT
jgi:homoserine kinase type II